MGLRLIHYTTYRTEVQYVVANYSSARVTAALLLSVIWVSEIISGITDLTLQGEALGKEYVRFRGLCSPSEEWDSLVRLRTRFQGSVGCVGLQ